MDSAEGSSAHVWRIACPAAAGKGLGRIPKDFFYDKNVPSKRALAENRYEADSASWSSSLLEGTPQRGAVHATQLGLHDLRRRGEV